MERSARDGTVEMVIASTKSVKMYKKTIPVIGRFNRLLRFRCATSKANPNIRTMPSSKGKPTDPELRQELKEGKHPRPTPSND